MSKSLQLTTPEDRPQIITVKISKATLDFLSNTAEIIAHKLDEEGQIAGTYFFTIPISGQLLECQDHLYTESVLSGNIPAGTVVET